MKNKNHMIISIDAEKSFDKIQHLFMIKTLHKVGTERTYLNIIKPNMKNPQLTSHSAVKFERIPIRSGRRQEYPLSPLLFSIELEVLATADKKKK